MYDDAESDREEETRDGDSVDEGPAICHEEEEVSAAPRLKGASYAGVVKRSGTKDRSWVEEVEREKGQSRAQEERKEEGSDEARVEPGMAEAEERSRNTEWLEEMKRRSSKARNVVFRDVNLKKEDVDTERVVKWCEAVLKRKVEVEDLWQEKEGMLIVRLKRTEDARELIQRRDEIWASHAMLIDSDRTFRERRCRWVVRQRAREERIKGKKVIEEDGRLCVDDTWWVWMEKEEKWVEENVDLHRKDNRGPVSEKVLSKREELARWRKDLERRMKELKIEETELEEAEREVLAAEGTENHTERVMEGIGTGTGENADSKEESESSETQPKEMESGDGQSSGYETRSSISSTPESRTQSSRSEPERDKKKKKKKKGESGQRGRRREDVEKWREDLERRKAEMKKEMEELEAEEAKERAAVEAKRARARFTLSQAGG